MTSAQPLLHDASVQVSAPTQAWSRAGGDMGGAPIDGVYHSDTRLVDRLVLRVDGEGPELLVATEVSARESVYESVVRTRDPGADPRLRVVRTRRVSAGRVDETVRLESGLPHAVTVDVAVAAHLDCTSIVAIKSGRTAAHPVECRAGDHAVAWSRGTVRARLAAPGAALALVAPDVTATWRVDLQASGTTTVAWSVEAADTQAVLQGPVGEPGWEAARIPARSTWLRHWVARSLDDLSALRVAARGTGDTLIGAGPPWFLTLFGRDSIWTARFLLPYDPGVALSTLRALARLQGTRVDDEACEQPGKIIHELRRFDTDVTDGLPPRYYGTVDATPLWLILLHEAWRAGADEAAVRDLLPAALRALNWLAEYGTGSDGFVRYRDTGHGLANQGWKDSGDSIRWRDGSLATPPIALSEVQAYAYQAALAGADLLDHFRTGDPAGWRAWAARLKERFAQSFWIDDPGGAYPAIALDASGERVDSVASNMGHLLGSGLLLPGQAELIARRLAGDGLNSGYGLRTLSRHETAYWPTSYHTGSVWPHDTTIAVLGLVKEGFRDEARTLADGLARAARSFDWRLPELYSGDGTDESPRPVPYPAACRPLSWAAAAPIAIAYALPEWDRPI